MFTGYQPQLGIPTWTGHEVADGSPNYSHRNIHVQASFIQPNNRVQNSLAITTVHFKWCHFFRSSYQQIAGYLQNSIRCTFLDFFICHRPSSASVLLHTLKEFGSPRKNRHCYPVTSLTELNARDWARILQGVVLSSYSLLTCFCQRIPRSSILTHIFCFLSTYIWNRGYPQLFQQSVPRSPFFCSSWFKF